MNEAWPGSHLGSLSHLCTRPHIDPHFSEDQPESLQTRQMMDESDDDFQELCASFFQRVKKNGPKEVSKEKKTQKTSNGTQIRSKPKRTKPTASKSKTPQGAAERKTCPGGQVPRTQKHRAPKRPETAPAPPENTEGGVPTSAVLQDSAWSTQTGNQSEPLPERTPEVICTILNQGSENFLKASKFLWLRRPYSLCPKLLPRQCIIEWAVFQQSFIYKNRQPAQDHSLLTLVLNNSH